MDLEKPYIWKTQHRLPARVRYESMHNIFPTFVQKFLHRLRSLERAKLTDKENWWILPEQCDEGRHRIRRESTVYIADVVIARLPAFNINDIFKRWYEVASDTKPSDRDAKQQREVCILCNSLGTVLFYTIRVSQPILSPAKAYLLFGVYVVFQSD